MTDDGFVLSDATIETAVGRRAPGHADASLLGDILLAAGRTPQVQPRAWALVPQRRATWALLAAAVLLLAALVAIGVGSLVVVPKPLPSPFAIAPPSDGSASQPPPTTALAPSPTLSAAAFCETNADVLKTGHDMPPTDTAFPRIADAVLSQGVFASRPNGGTAIDQDDIWAARGGTVARLASIAGADATGVFLDDLSPDGQQVVFQAFVNDPDPGVLPICNDTYIARTDGSSIERLMPGRYVLPPGASFSADGNLVAAFLGERDGLLNGVGLVDLTGDRTMRELDCLPGQRPVSAWAPTGARLAVLCDEAIKVFEGDRSIASLPLPGEQEILVGLGWVSPDALSLLTVGGADSPIAPFNLRTLSLDGTTATEPVVLSPRLTDGNAPARPAPDGHSIAFFATPNGTAELGWYEVDLATAATRKLIDGFADTVREVGWSTDGGSFVYLEPPTGPETPPRVTTVDLGSGERQSVELPPGCGDAIWPGV